MNDARRHLFSVVSKEVEPSMPLSHLDRVARLPGSRVITCLGFVTPHVVVATQLDGDVIEGVVVVHRD